MSEFLGGSGVPVGIHRGELGHYRQFDAAILQLCLERLERRKSRERVVRIVGRDVNERDPVRESIARVS
jgi:hypothetical protein